MDHVARFLIGSNAPRLLYWTVLSRIYEISLAPISVYTNHHVLICCASMFRYLTLEMITYSPFSLLCLPSFISPHPFPPLLPPSRPTPRPTSNSTFFCISASLHPCLALSLLPPVSFSPSPCLFVHPSLSLSLPLSIAPSLSLSLAFS